MQASAMSTQPTPQASPLAANGLHGQADPPGDPSSPPLVQEGSAARSEGVAQGEQTEPLPNGVCCQCLATATNSGGWLLRNRGLREA